MNVCVCLQSVTFFFGMLVAPSAAWLSKEPDGRVLYLLSETVSKMEAVGWVGEDHGFQSSRVESFFNKLLSSLEGLLSAPAGDKLRLLENVCNDLYGFSLVARHICERDDAVYVYRSETTDEPVPLLPALLSIVDFVWPAFTQWREAQSRGVSPEFALQTKVTTDVEPGDWVIETLIKEAAQRAVSFLNFIMDADLSPWLDSEEGTILKLKRCAIDTCEAAAINDDGPPLDADCFRSLVLLQGADCVQAWCAHHWDNLDAKKKMTTIQCLYELDSLRDYAAQLIRGHPDLHGVAELKEIIFEETGERL